MYFLINFCINFFLHLYSLLKARKDHLMSSSLFYCNWGCEEISNVTVTIVNFNLDPAVALLLHPDNQMTSLMLHLFDTQHLLSSVYARTEKSEVVKHVSDISPGSKAVSDCMYPTDSCLITGSQLKPTP